MKKQFVFIIMAIAMILGCAKDGEQGPKGDQGAKGDQGPAGVKGNDGTTVLSGTTAPAIAIGKLGDYYLDLALGNLYGPKTDNSWGNPVSLKGPKGDNGTPGKDGLSLLSGNGTPTMNIGKVGDLYFNLNSLTIHGPKTPDNWGSEVSLASTQKSGVQIYLMKNVKFNTPKTENASFNETKPNFYYKNNEINLGSLNINKGISFIYWRYNGTIGDTGPLLNNYFTFSWNQIISNGQSENHAFENINMNFRIDPFLVGFNTTTKSNFIQFQLIGNEQLAEGQTPHVEQFNNFIEKASFDILIKYIPESSAVLISKNKARELLSIN